LIQPTPYFDDFLTYYDKATVLQNFCNLGGQSYLGQVNDDLMEQVHIYDTVERRYAGFSNMLQDLWHGTNTPKFHKLNGMQREVCLRAEDLHDRWQMEDWIYVFLLHRLTGSGASFESDHGYRNTILPQLVEMDGIDQMKQFIKVYDRPMFTSIGNQIPAFPKPNFGYKTGGKLYLCELAPMLARELVDYIQNNGQLFGRKVTIRELADYMCAFNKSSGINAFHFVFTAIAADLADYYPELVDEDSHMYYGKNAKEAMDLFATKVGKGTKDQFYDAVMKLAVSRTGGAPRDLEDVMCDYIRYVENYIPDNREQTYAHLDRAAVWNNSAIKSHPKGRQP
jgi:hypothetical protein